MTDFKLFWLVFFALCYWFGRSDGGYLITTPRMYRPGTVHRVNVHLYGNNMMWKITASLMGYDKTFSVATKTIPGNSYSTIYLKVPQNAEPMQNYRRMYYVDIHVHGISQDGKHQFKKEHPLFLDENENKDAFFIQTEKPIYNPGETVRIRVIGVKRVKNDLKPLEGKVKRIFISNPNGVRMAQWDDVDFKNGIANVEMLLSKRPVLGKWTIEASYREIRPYEVGKQVEKTIIVKKYALPKFKVIIEPPSFVALDSKDVSGAICARYDHGQPVIGEMKAVIAVEVKQRTGNFKIYASKFVSKKIKGCFRFSFTNEDFGLYNLTGIGKFAITANITEDVTGVTKFGRAEVEIHQFRLKIISIRPYKWKLYWPGLPFTDVLSVTTIDGEPVNNEKVNIIAYSGYTQDSVEIFNKQYTVSNGIINYEIPTSINVSILNIQARHHKSKELGLMDYSSAEITYIAHRKFMANSSSFLSIKRGLYIIKAGETAKIDLMLTVSGDEGNNDFVYQLLCGQTHVSGKTRLSSFKRTSQTTAEGSFEFLLLQTLQVSSCRLLVYYVKEDGEVVADYMSLRVQRKSNNQVVVRFNNKHPKPGERVEIAIKAAPGSTVALSAIDKRLRQETEDITAEKVFSTFDVDWMSTLTFAEVPNPISSTFYYSGFVPLSDSHTLAVPVSKMRQRYRRSPQQATGIPQQSRLRQSMKKSKQPQDQSLDTWLWTEETVSNSTGEKIITVRVPDSITSWHLSAFAMSSTHGMGVAEPTSLTVSRPFFVSLTVPYAVVRDEKVSLVTRVFSYMKTCATVAIQLKPTADFQLISTNNRRLCICGDDPKSVNHVIKPTKLGKIYLTVTVKNVAPSLCKNPSQEPSLGISDSDTRMLRVEAEGDSQEYTFSDMICPAGKYEDEIKLDLPKDVVSDSIHATFSVTGDVMGPTLMGFEKIIKLPTGCGEQNMVNFAPNIYVMQYLNSTKLKVDDIMETAANFLRAGYQQELTYKRQDGSYSAFGDKDKEGSLWLTAFVLRSFSQARQFIFIDEKEIESITKWIESKQLGSGCFEKHGELFRKELKGGVSSSVTLTAYVTIALLESKVNSQSDVIVKALRCIVNQQDSVTDTYSNAIIAYALTLANHPARANFLKRLETQAIVKDGKMHWKKKHLNQQKQNGSVRPSHRSSSINIEMTGYALMAIIGDGNDTKALYKARPIVKWLSNQRNGHGGFSSTQDTCVALQALSIFGRYVYGELADFRKLHAGHNHPKTWMVIDIKDSKGFKQKFRVTHSNRFRPQIVELPSRLLPTKLKIKAVGRGCALVQADVSYNIKTILAGPSFQLSSSVRRRRDSKVPVLRTDAGEKLCHPLEINICAQWREKDKSDMAVIEVKLVSGFEPDEESLDKLLSRKDVSLKRFEIDDNKVVLYFDEIKDVCVTFGIDQTSVVTSMRPATVTVYDYYDPDKAASSQYTITNNLCTTQPDA